MVKEQFLRIERFIGLEALERLEKKTVAVAGVGAVGGFAAEALVRSGIGRIKILDFDTISETNINRQIIATHKTVGRLKTEVMEERLKDINPDLIVEAYPVFLSEENHHLLFDGADLVLDCIDSLNPKVNLLADAFKNNVPIISSMGAALRRNPSLIRFSDIMDTWGCPLAKQVRSGLRRRGVERGIECVFSPEKVDFTYIDPEDDDKAERMIDRGRKRVVLGSLPTVTAIFGQMIAHLALQRLLGDEMFDGKEEWNPNLKKR
ncbi:MAG: tRNA threonylcarbamoyladenosine dehydratase [Spirochaetales bacterium]|nr:tRNA threonylcarbamoyladenosine dehydratase [Spirochaetales bacterium]